MSRPLRRAMGGMVKFGAAATGLGVVTTGIAFAADSVKKAMSFESQMSTIQALTGATDEQTKAMQQLALQQGALTKYSALEAAQGIEELLKAGMSTAQVQAGGLNAALNLATAGGLGLAESAEIMSTALNSFKKDGLTASQAADILAGTANASATDVHDLRYSLAAVGSVADGVGMSFRDTNTALGLFANNGLKGSDAGTSLKTMLSNLVPMTDKAYGMFEDFNLLTVNTTDALAFMSKKGIKSTGTSVQAVTKDIEKYVSAQTGLKVGTSKAAKETKKFLTASNLVHSAFYDNKGQIKDLAQVADLLKNRFGKLTNEQRQYYLHQIFGSDAIRAGNILFKEGAAGVKKFQQEMANVTALSVATKKMDNAAGAVEQFQGAIETLQISALLPTMPILKKLAQAAADFVVKYTPRITAAMQRAVDTSKTYLKTHFINNPEFNKLPDIKSKIAFVFDDVKKTLSDWWSGGASDKFAQFGRESAVAIGKNFANTIATSPEFAFILGLFVAGKAPGPIGLPIALSIIATPWVMKTLDFLRENLGEISGLNKADRLVQFSKDSQNRPAGEPIIKGPTVMQEPSGGAFSKWWRETTGNSGWSGHASGLDTVPYNGYPARLHKDEAVLTKHEASEWRDQQRGKGGHGGVVINMYGTTIREDADIDKLARQLAMQLAR
ncbi:MULTISPECIES: phage tail tape measure protein [Paenibacillus]|uniref:phage tail tape measure protein n=1 Tax=Paenibacillus TaxID=44249 RepID=UPI00142E495C|nr:MULTISPECIES: phage tail tape measure protein [Paenibacillus]KAF6658861.1 phage tail tape measure protein [Paenibacillus sp. EKM301P]WHX33907.1 phage tail tape measure protein [Paenibacillus polymyxa]